MHSIYVYIFLKHNSATKRVFSDLKLSFPESRRNFTLVAQNKVFGGKFAGTYEKQAFPKKHFSYYISLVVLAEQARETPKLLSGWLRGRYGNFAKVLQPPEHATTKSRTESSREPP